jgi:cytochrome c556
MPKSYSACVLALAMVLAPSVAISHSDLKNPQTRYRHQVMKAATSHANSLKELVNYKLPFNGQHKIHAEALRIFFNNLPALFPQNGDYAESDADPKIWQEWDRFNAISREGADAAAILARTTSPESPEALDAYRSLRHSCKSCHDSFRQ